LARHGLIFVGIETAFFRNFRSFVEQSIWCMKKALFTLILFFSLFQAFASHTKGGWMYYEYLGQGITDPNKLRYKIVLKLYIICNPSTGQLDNPINFSFFNAGTNAFIENVSVPISSNINVQNCTLTACNPCISNIPSICYKILTYELIRELTPTAFGYTISWQRCCRIVGLSNVQAPSNAVGATYSITIPGTSIGLNATQNNSPQFNLNDTAIVCENSFFSVNFGATDADNDSLVYSFCPAWTGGDQDNPVVTTASNPPYGNIPYSGGFTGSTPLGPQVTINPATGVVSGIAPNSGEYVVTVCVLEYRGGILIARSRKELHLRVADCVPIRANPMPSFVTCDGFNVQFSHTSSGANSVYWDFGVSGMTNDTSNLNNPVFVYPDTGTYIIKFVINRGQPCSDSVTRRVGVYPGFFPGFITSQPVCIGVPVQFNDTTLSIYTPTNSWNWNFGNPSGTGNTSTIKNPVHTYANAGTYNVTLIVASNLGCIDTVVKPITVLPPPPINMLFKDSTYCGLDTLQLGATGTGTFTWTPNTFIIGANTATPSVFPPVPTSYFVTLDANGCISRDTVRVRPINDLTASIQGINSICEEDTTQFTGIANRSPIVWQWSNLPSVESPNSRITRVYPTASTNYTLTARWGNNCVATATKNLNVIPLAVPVVGPDAAFCAGSGGVTLSASGGNTYTWSPPLGLSATNIPNPQATPTATTTYTVTVGVNGCSRTRRDSVVVTVRPLPQLTLINDTLICVIDTLQLSSSGNGNFTWTPNYNINSLTGANPLVSPDVTTTYYTTLTDVFGCQTKDSVRVNVKPFVTLDAGNDTTLCRTDGFNLNVTSDALTYQWTPATYLDRDDVKRPFTRPLSTIKYYVTANIGKCQSYDSVNIQVVPYPTARASNDTTICIGTNAQLQASGGSNYAWSPANFLNATNIPNPAALGVPASIRYIVTVTDTLGCPKPAKDTVWVRVYPRVVADAGPRDTTVVLGQPLLLTGTGGDIYLWEPGTWLSNPTVANVVSTPQADIEYRLLVRNLAGCEGRDSIRVKVYDLEASMYVPTAFTPNGDRVNDVLRPIMLGMKELTYFRVYNRWGQMMYSTVEQNKGWDGIFAGKPQHADTYVWEAVGVTFKNQVIRKKGYAVLIR
jgi:gliding motility-associated-like protein